MDTNTNVFSFELTVGNSFHHLLILNGKFALTCSSLRPRIPKEGASIGKQLMIHCEPSVGCNGHASGFAGAYIPILDACLSSEQVCITGSRVCVKSKNLNNLPSQSSPRHGHDMAVHTTPLIFHYHTSNEGRRGNLCLYSEEACVQTKPSPFRRRQ